MPFSYPHMCRDDHIEIGHADGGDDERCPLCQQIARAETAEAALSVAREEGWRQGIEAAAVKALSLGAYYGESAIGGAIADAIRSLPSLDKEKKS